MDDPVYKIAPKAEWQAARASGTFTGTQVDIDDGYIHFSAPGQLASTLEKHYSGRAGLVLATVDPALLPMPLTWEPARGGELFPHLYAPLPFSAVIAERDLDARPDGGFDLPEIA